MMALRQAGDQEMIVKVEAIGIKVGNLLFIRGKPRTL
jgi:hypothetical protein